MFVNIIQNQFSLSQFELVQIRKALFAGLFESPELLRTENLSKKEWALDGHSLVYPKAGKIKSQLGKLFETETLFEFDGLDSKQIYKHCASFISGLWALHPFESCNTRTIAVFFIKYLAFRGFPLGNDVLSQSAVYFRNALARAAFCDGKKGIHKTTRYLERLIKKMMFGGRTVLDPRETHLYYDSNGVVLKSDAAAQKERSPSERLDEKLLAPKKAAAKKQADKPEPAKKRAVSAKAPSKAKKSSSKKK